MPNTVDYTVKTTYTSDTAGLTAAKRDLRALNEASRDLWASQQLAEQAARDSGEAFGSLGRKARRAQRELEQIERQLEDGADASHAYARQVRGLDAAYEQGLISQRRHAELLDLAHRKYRSNTSALGAYVIRIRGWVGAMAASLAVLAGAGIVSAGDQQEQLLNQLEIALKSRQAAEVEFGRLAEFAATTPVQLAEITDGFAKLSVRGLQPTIDDLRTFGDIAGGSRKSLEQMVEAVLDASVGDGARLNEFGIKMRTAGEEVTLTFANMALTVPKEAEAIKRALLEIGEANFAGGLAKQAETLSGKWSTLKDASNQLGAALYGSGIGDSLKEIADGAIYAVNALSDLVVKFRDLEGVDIAFSPVGLIENALEGYVEGADAEIAALVRDGAELRDVLHGTQAALDSLDASNIEGELGRLRDQVSATERLIDALGQQANDARDLGNATDYASAQDEQSQQIALLGEMRQRVADLEQALDQLGDTQRDQGAASREQGAAFAELTAGARAELAILEELHAAARAGETDLAGLRANLATLQQQGLPIDGGPARAELAAVRRKVRELGEAIEQIQRLSVFEQGAEHDIARLEALIAAAEVPGVTLGGLERLEGQLRALEGLGIPIDAEGEGARRVRELAGQIATLTERLAGLRGELGSIETFDVVPLPGTAPGVDYTATDETPAAYPEGLGNEQVDQAIRDAQTQLDAMSAAVSASLRDGLVSALESAAAAGRITFEGMFDGLRSQLPALFERQALAGVTLTGDAALDTAATEAALDEAAATAAAVSSVLGAYYAVYSIVDSWVDQKHWERANTGAVKLEERLGKIAVDLQRSGSAVSTALVQTGETAVGVIEDILFGFGASLERLGTAAVVEFRINEGQYEVAVGEYVRRFGEASQQAFEYFVTRALKLAEIDGLPDEVQRTLRSTDAESLAALEQELRLAEEIHRLPWDQTQRSIAQIEQRMRDLFRFAEERLLAVESYENIGAAAALDLADLYNSITGRSTDPHEAFTGQAETFNRLRAELVAQAQTEIEHLFEQLAGLTNDGLQDFVDVIGPMFTGIFSDSPIAEDIQRPILLINQTLQGLNVASDAAQALEQLRGRLAGLQAFLGALPPAIGPGDYQPPSGAGRQRRETREEFAADLERLRALAEGVSEVSIALDDEATAWEEQAERFRRAGVAQSLLDEWLALQEQLSDADFLAGIRERGEGLGLSDFQASLADLRSAHAAEIEEARLRGVSVAELAEIEAIHRAELEALIVLRERELQQYSDLANGISPWQRQLLDLDDFFETAVGDQLALIAAQEGLAGSSRALAEALAELDAAQHAAANALYGDLLQRLDAAGVVIPGFGKTMLDLEFAMLRADLAAAAAREGFLEFLRAQNLTLDGLFAGIDTAYQQALAALEAPGTAPGTPTAGLGADVARDDRIALETQRALDAVASALLEIRGADPRKSEGERVADLEIRYRQALDAALAGDPEAAEDAARLALELRAAMEQYAGTSTGQYLALISRLDSDLAGLERSLQNQLSDRQLQEEHLAVLVQIRDAIEAGNADEPEAPEAPEVGADGREPTNPGTKGEGGRPKFPGDLPDDLPDGVPRRDVHTVGSRRPLGIELPRHSYAPILPRAASSSGVGEGEALRLLGRVVDLLEEGNTQRQSGQQKQGRRDGALEKALSQLSRPRPTTLRAAARDPFGDPFGDSVGEREAGGRGGWPGGGR